MNQLRIRLLTRRNLALLSGILVSIGIGVWYGVLSVPSITADEFTSSELGLASFSPSGPGGGIAIPASGASPPPPPPPPPPPTPNLSVDNLLFDFPVFDSRTGEYILRLAAQVNSEADTVVNVPYEYILTPATTIPPMGAVERTITDSLPPIAAGGSDIAYEQFQNTIFGDYTVAIEVDQPDPGAINPESDEVGDNVASRMVTLPQPALLLAITAQPGIVRSGGTTEITASVDVLYDVECTLIGPGINEQFDGNNVDGDGDGDPDTPLQITASTPQLYNEARYTIECDTPLYGGQVPPQSLETFVQVIPTYEE